MSNQGKVGSASKLNEVIFKDKAHVSATNKFRSLFPGLGYAAAYKVRLQITLIEGAVDLTLNRSYKEYTNTVDNLLLKTTWLNTTATPLTEHLVKATAKP